MSQALPVSALLEAMAESLSASDIVASAAKVKVSGQIVDWRVSHNLTQKEFASYMEVSQGQVSRWENGDCNFSIEKLAEIACKLDLQLNISLESAKAKTMVLQCSQFTPFVGGNVVSLFQSLPVQQAVDISTDLAYGEQKDCSLDLMEG